MRSPSVRENNSAQPDSIVGACGGHAPRHQPLHETACSVSQVSQSFGGVLDAKAHAELQRSETTSRHASVGAIRQHSPGGWNCTTSRHCFWSCSTPEQELRCFNHPTPSNKLRTTQHHVRVPPGTMAPSRLRGTRWRIVIIKCLCQASWTAGIKRLQKVLWWRQSCRASTPTLTSSKRHSLRPAGRTSDFQFQLTSLRVFTLPSSLKRCYLHSRESRGTPPFNWHRERERDVQTFHIIVRAF